ncbi:MAG: hypothetical protein ACFFD6_10700, partial [Candidatus Thorarchaeota archaeon]
GDRGRLAINGNVIEFSDTRYIDDRSTLIATEPVEVGVQGILSIDMKWRRAMMRNHTSEHLFVAAMKRANPDVELGYIWITGDQGTVDLEGIQVSFQDLMKGEHEVQLAIDNAIPIKTSFVRASELDSNVRAREGLTDKHELVRVVEIGNFDSSACSGIHVTNTREIEVFKILDFKKSESGVRVTFCSGNRARVLLTSIYNEVLHRKHSYPFEMEQIGEVLDKAKATIDEHKLIIEKLTQILSEGPTTEDITGVTFIHESIAGLDSKAMKTILKKMIPSGPTAILLFAPGEKCNLTLFTHELPHDAGDYISDVVERLGGKGGGSRDAYNGGFTGADSPERIYDEIVDHLRQKLML